MAYVVSRLSTGTSLSPEETEQIEKIGGRMIDLELVSLALLTTGEGRKVQRCLYSLSIRFDPDCLFRMRSTRSLLEA
jgi:hypothetical protein